MGTLVKSTHFYNICTSIVFRCSPHSLLRSLLLLSFLQRPLCPLNPRCLRFSRFQPQAFLLPPVLSLLRMLLPLLSLFAGCHRSRLLLPVGCVLSSGGSGT